VKDTVEEEAGAIEGERVAGVEGVVFSGPGAGVGLRGEAFAGEESGAVVGERPTTISVVCRRVGIGLGVGGLVSLLPGTSLGEVSVSDVCVEGYRRVSRSSMV